MKITTLHMDKIKPYYRNARNNDETIPALVRSIERYGFNVPIVVDEKGVIITGHSRYRALLSMGKEDAQVIVKAMTHEKAKEYRLLDNKTQEYSSWERELLEKEILSMEDWEDVREQFDGKIDEILGMTIDEVPEEEISYVMGTEETVSDELPEEIAEIYEEMEQSEKKHIKCPYCDCLVDVVDDQVE